jgi:predicted nucleotidyltransferase
MTDIMKTLSKLEYTSMAPFGSRVVGCATEKSDYDYLVLVHRRPSTRDMDYTGFYPDADNPLYGTYFSSWRKDDVNLIFTDSAEYFNATMDACEFCKKYKVYDKADRCMIHEKFRDAIKSDELEFN